MDINCSVLVPTPLDVSPIRSPQAVHTVLARHFAGKSVVEIGTRKGDGMACFSQVASSAVAIEPDKEYCTFLRQRSHEISRNTAKEAKSSFSVQCTTYQAAKGIPDADFYTWWQQAPFLVNHEILPFLGSLVNKERIRPTATAALIFDPQWPGDRRSWNALERFTHSSVQVAYDEFSECNRRSGPQCHRARGSFIVAMIQLRSLPDDPALLAPRDRGRRLNAFVDPLPPAAIATTAVCLISAAEINREEAAVEVERLLDSRVELFGVGLGWPFGSSGVPPAKCADLPRALGMSEEEACDAARCEIAISRAEIERGAPFEVVWRFDSSLLRARRLPLPSLLNNSVYTSPLAAGDKSVGRISCGQRSAMRAYLTGAFEERARAFRSVVRVAAWAWCSTSPPVDAISRVSGSSGVSADRDEGCLLPQRSLKPLHH